MFSAPHHTQPCSQRAACRAAQATSRIRHAGGQRCGHRCARVLPPGNQKAVSAEEARASLATVRVAPLSVLELRTRRPFSRRCFQASQPASRHGRYAHVSLEQESGRSSGIRGHFALRAGKQGVAECAAEPPFVEHFSSVRTGWLLDKRLGKKIRRHTAGHL